MTTEPTAIPGTDASRRRWLMAGAALTAGLGGAGLALRHNTPQTMASGAEGMLWGLKLETPSGRTVAVDSFRGKPLLLNFWATWCPPCVEELPLLNRFYGENHLKGWQVLGLAVDQKTAVNGFLAKMPLDFVVAMAGMSGIELSKSLGNLGGGLPFTAVLGAQGIVLHRKMGRVMPDDLAAWAALK